MEHSNYLLGVDFSLQKTANKKRERERELVPCLWGCGARKVPLSVEIKRERERGRGTWGLNVRSYTSKVSPTQQPKHDWNNDVMFQ